MFFCWNGCPSCIRSGGLLLHVADAFREVGDAVVDVLDILVCRVPWMLLVLWISCLMFCKSSFFAVSMVILAMGFSIYSIVAAIVVGGPVDVEVAHRRGVALIVGRVAWLSAPATQLAGSGALAIDVLVTHTLDLQLRLGDVDEEGGRTDARRHDNSKPSREMRKMML